MAIESLKTAVEHLHNRWQKAEHNLDFRDRFYGLVNAIPDFSKRI
jgi:hypothetical protein